MQLRIAVLAGDGIGPEVTREAVQVLEAVAHAGGHKLEFTTGLIGGVAITAEGRPLPQATIVIRSTWAKSSPGLGRATLSPSALM